VLSDGSVYPRRGEPLLADRNVDLRTGTIMLEGSFPNPEGLLRPGQFATLADFNSMMRQFPEYGIMSIGMSLTMLTGGIDLGVVGTANLSAIVAATSLVLYFTWLRHLKTAYPDSEFAPVVTEAVAAE